MFESLEAHAQQVVEFVRVHEAWAAPIVFALAFGESLAFISLLIPAWAALVGIGVLISHGNLNFWPIWVAGSIGAALGDWLSYWIGVKLGPPVAHMWPLSRHPELLPKGEAFVKRWAYLRSSSAVSSDRCAPRSRWSPASSGCPRGNSRLRTSARRSFGLPCCLPWATW